MLNFGVELSRSPAGIAEREESLSRTSACGNDLENVEARGQRQGVVHTQAALASPVSGMQHEAACIINRATGTKPDLPRRRHWRDFKLAEQIVEGWADEGAIKHKPHRSVASMRTHVDHGLGEARIGHRRHCDSSCPVRKPTGFACVSSAVSGMLAGSAGALKGSSTGAIGACGRRGLGLAAWCSCHVLILGRLAPLCKVSESCRCVTLQLGSARSVAANPQGARMTIKVGDTIPSMKLMVSGPEGPKEVSTDGLFKGKKVVLFAVPGAFTPTCSAKHLPGFVQNADAILAKGVRRDCLHGS